MRKKYLFMKLFCLVTASLLLTSCAKSKLDGEVSAEMDVEASISSDVSAEGSLSMEPEDEAVEIEYCNDPEEEYRFQYGNSFSYYAVAPQNPDRWIDYDLSNVPSRPFCCTVKDFDSDGVDEKLLISAVPVTGHEKEGMKEYTLSLRMYEEEDDKFRVSAETELSSEDIFLPWATFAYDTNFSSFVDCYTYGENEVRIAVETADLASLFSDGLMYSFASYTYTGDAFVVAANSTLCGSDFDEEFAEDYVQALSDVGINLNWDEYLAQVTYISNHVKNYNCMLYLKYKPRCSYDEAAKWTEDKSEPLEYVSVDVYSEYDIDDRNAKDVKYEEPFPSSQMPDFEASSNKMLKAYINTLERFTFHEKLPDGKKVTPFEPISENRFAICDVDNDGEDELLIDYCHTSNSQMTLYIFKYDWDSGNVVEESSFYSNFAFYGNDYVKVAAGHNGTPSEFWPYSFYGYESESDSYRLVSTVTGFDKDRETEGMPFPNNVDKDKNGRVYRLIDHISDEDQYVDDKAYEKWVKSYIGTQKETVLNWMSTTEEDIYALLY